MSTAEKTILLIMPPVSRATEAIKKNLASYNELPYGLLSLASYIIEQSSSKVQIEIMDLNVVQERSPQEAIAEAMTRLKPQIVGISGLFSSMFDYVNEFSQLIKNQAPDAILVVGGNIATNCYEILFKANPHIDAACYAEGELPMLQLVEAEAPHELLESSPAWMTRRKIEQGKTPSPDFIGDLDQIPPIDYSLVDLTKYDSRCRNNNPVRHEESNAVRLPLVTTRGCPFNCVFCAAHSLSGKKVRFMSAERVISDIKRAKEKYGMTRVVINDDQALIDKKRINKILSAIAELKLVLEFPSGLNVQFIDEELALKLKQAGLDVANLAIESGSEHVLNHIIDKPLKIKDVKPAVETLRRHGLLVHGFFIFGFPGERDEDRTATLELIREAGLDWANIYAAAALRGSRLYDIFVQQGFIADDEGALSSNIYESPIMTAAARPESITQYVYRVNLDVNFVNNYRMKIGDFSIARGYFQNVVSNHPSHAFAHYYLARALQGLNGDRNLIESHRAAFSAIIRDDSEWAGHAQEFGLV
jgi:anaerobic magnesium-protoporphyrin IX monomethyl ester cyclase